MSSKDMNKTSIDSSFFVRIIFFFLEKINFISIFPYLLTTLSTNSILKLNTNQMTGYCSWITTLCLFKPNNTIYNDRKRC